MDSPDHLTAQAAGQTNAILACSFRDADQITALPMRNAPHWHSLLRCRHLGIHRPHAKVCNWTARILTTDKRYLQKCLGPALDTGRGIIGYDEAVRRAFEWFGSGEVQAIANSSKPTGRTGALNFCPLGPVYTVGHALRDYMDWSKLARSQGGHYNNLILINHHIASELIHLPLEEFTAKHLQTLALRVLQTPPRFGFSPHRPAVNLQDLEPDELRKRKKTFNSLVTILRMAFQHAWDNGQISSERPWRCLKRIAVNHSPRTIFLSRDECTRLIEHCTPALRQLVLAALYSGCRVGELGNLRVEDVGHQIFGLRISAFKRSPARFVFLPDEGMAFFLSCCEGKAGRDRVLLSDKDKVWKRQHANLFRRALLRAGLPKDFVFHGLRHTYASDLVRQGVPLDIVARQLGHADVKTVSSTYGHLAEQFREEQIRSRFSPLASEQQAEAIKRRGQMDRIWHALQRDDWRSYGKLEPESYRPRQSYVRTSKEVLAAFGEGTGQGSHSVS
jgi:integrase/recombinase XerD